MEEFIFLILVLISLPFIYLIYSFAANKLEFFKRHSTDVETLVFMTLVAFGCAVYLYFGGIGGQDLQIHNLRMEVEKGKIQNQKLNDTTRDLKKMMKEVERLEKAYKKIICKHFKKIPTEIECL